MAVSLMSSRNLSGQWCRVLRLLNTSGPSTTRHSSTACVLRRSQSQAQPWWVINAVNTTRLNARCLSVSAHMASLISSENIVRSPIPDLDIPVQPFHEMIFDKCDQFKDKLALEEFLTGKSYTYSQLKENVVRVAAGLHAQGYRKGHVILAYSPNCADYCLLMLACSMLGVWFSSANPALTPGELARQLEHCDCRGVVTVAPLAENVHQALANPDFSHQVKDLFVFGECPGFQPFQSLLDHRGQSVPDVDIDPLTDVLVLPYSSGTTGFPKGVMLTHYNCCANTRQTRACSPSNPDERVLGLLPLYHIYGMIVVQYLTLTAGASLHLLPKFEPETFLRCLQDRKITYAPLVPPLALFLCKHPLAAKFDLTALKHVVIGAAPLGTEISQEFWSKYPHLETLNQGYGMTELSPASHIDTKSRIGTIGNLVPNTLGKVVDLETGATLGAGQEGELAVKGPLVMKGYHKNLKATEDMIVDGWLYTGDIAVFDHEGTFTVRDRLKELIKYKGNQVPPAELEALLLSHPDVQDVAVIGVPDLRAGELPKAFVVRKPGAQVTEDEICRFVEERISDTKRLRGGAQFVQEIPKNPSGKILRRVLRQTYESQ